jgi:hypothetical protein
VSLTAYEGADVVQSTIRITRAGDGLSDGLNIDPVEYHLGDKVHVVLECVVTRVAHEPVKDTDVLKRVHTLAAEMGTIVGHEVVDAVLDEQRVKIEKARGVERLPLGSEGDDDDGD